MKSDKLLQNTMKSLQGKLMEYKNNTPSKNLVPSVEDDKSDRDTIEYFKTEIQNGHHEPILVSETDDTIIDGNHRLVAYKELGIEPPLLYIGNRKDFFSVVPECNYDGIKAIKEMIKNGTAKPLN